MAEVPAELEESPSSVTGDAEAQAPADGGADLDYEIELNTPFGIVELEFEPRAKQERRARERKERAERKAAQRAVAEAAKKAERARRSGSLLRSIAVALVVLAVVGGLVALVIWLFARPGEEEDAIPDELLASPDPLAPPPGLVERTRTRVRDAIRQGRRASRDAQREQEQRYREMTNRS